MTIQQGSRIAKAPLHEAGEPRRSARGKFAPPRFPSDLVAVARWQTSLDAIARHEICLVNAPAGYGKTAFAATLFAHARSSGWGAGWVSFDPEDNEPAAIGHLFEAVRIARGAPVEDSITALSAVPASGAILAAALAERIEAEDRPMLLVLDDIDRLTDPRAIEVFDRLLRHPPAELRLLLTGRAQPAARLAEAQGRGMVLRLGPAEIGLTDDEVGDFLRTAGLASGPDAHAKLNALLGGWPAGLRMGVPRLDRAARGDPTALVAQIDRYLAPLFDGANPETRQFLMHGSVAPQLNEELVRLLGEGDPGVETLNDLQSRGSFVDRADDGGGWCHVHPAVRAMFRQRLDESEPQRAAELHRVTARYYEAQGLVADAIDQFLAAGALADAARLTAGHALALLGQGELDRFAGWIDALPVAAVAADRALVRASAWLAVMLAGRNADAAIALLKAEGEETEARAAALLHAVYTHDRPDSAVEEADRLLASSDGLSDFAADMVRAALASGAQRRGLFGLVHDVVRPLGLREPATGCDIPQALATRAKAASARAQGQLVEAERVLREGRQMLAPHGLAGALVDAGLARCRYERDDLAGAARLVSSALAALEPSCFQDAIVQAFQIGIRIAAADGRVDDAASLIDRAERMAFARDWTPLKAMCVVERVRLRLPPTIDAEAVVATGDEEAALRDPLSASARAFALIAEMRAYEAIASGDRPRLTLVAERLLRLASNADDAELRASAALFNILPQLSGRCDKMVELETVRFLNHAASVGFRRTIVDVLDVTGVRAVQNFCSEAYASGSFLALLKLADPSRRDPALEGPYSAAPGEAFSFLTEREIEILSALHAGESNKEIARTLQLAPETVKWHLKNVMRKLRATSREEAVANAATLGLKLPEGNPG
ncbi:LuxR C-terminal-related transcriptional regulator [Sphingopyxis sp.]|uniref:LuxR C-terminal-related transcriptional regulator n=1 Tax=Sphingopyxis sp. TaxID=1908224 RepID=UPI003D0E5E5B